MAAKAIVSGLFHLQADKVDEFLAAWNVCREITLKEEGCIKYDVSIDRHDNTKFVLYEEWESEELLAAHSARLHVPELIGKVKSFLASPPVVNKYKIAGLISSI